MDMPKDRKYSIDHEWVIVEGDEATIGITEYAQDALGEVVYVDLPDEGESFAVGDTFGEVESVKSVSELFMPVSGEVIAINDSLADAPETINDDCYGDGWMIRVRIENESGLADLLDAEAYLASIDE
ncbi:MAG: glycine cleavage system protein GcvH [Coriobacteriia bacterium]|nr:glycine cleavage system protein GcvH [Coriobacteriia bacterium]